MKSLISSLSHAGWCRLLGWGSRNYRNQRLEWHSSESITMSFLFNVYFCDYLLYGIKYFFIQIYNFTIQVLFVVILIALFKIICLVQLWIPNILAVCYATKHGHEKFDLQVIHKKIVTHSHTNHLRVINWSCNDWSAP